MNEKRNREKIIIRTSIIGIVANIFLAGFKAVVGLLSHSIAIVLDAVNNLSDAVSSIVTIIGTKLANKAPDKKHPMGHGRAEYLSAMIVAAIVLYAGITSLVESVKKIIHPEKAEYTKTTIIILVVAIIVKVILGTYVKKVGKDVNSGSLVASGSDALNDAIISTSVLFSAIIFITTGIGLEAYVGVIISVVIIKAGMEMLLDTLDDIIGRRVDSEIVNKIKKLACEEEEVHGAFDLDLHNYGPDKFIGSIHVEVDDTLTAGQVDALIRRIQSRVLAETGIILESITIYSVNTTDEEIKAMHKEVQEMVTAHEGVLSIHGFYADKKEKIIRFDYVVSYDEKEKEKLYDNIVMELEEKYPDYNINVITDYDIS